MFVDEVDIHVTAGHGGRGCLAFRREKRVPRGGPSGGDGGHGGSIYITATPRLNTLINFRFHPEFDAERGRHGEGSNRTGHTGADLELHVPVGTLIFEKHGDGGLDLVADLTEAGQRVLVAHGGRGGRGNAQFASSTNRAPRRTEPGEPGEEKFLRLQLKLLADVGLVGFPNAGKSTLISTISAARPKIADYPFTTLVPNLGVVTMSGDRSFVVADVPGLIEGAHRGLGLGHQFLRHLERTQVLVHVIDVSEGSNRDPVEDFTTVRRELELFRQDLASKPQIVAANKIDALSDRDRLDRLTTHVRERGLEIFPISAVTRAGLPALLEAMWPHVAAAREAAVQLAVNDEQPPRAPLAPLAEHDHLDPATDTAPMLAVRPTTRRDTAAQRSRSRGSATRTRNTARPRGRATTPKSRRKG
jgi:GTP-binding protein